GLPCPAGTRPARAAPVCRHEPPRLRAGTTQAGTTQAGTTQAGTTQAGGSGQVRTPNRWAAGRTATVRAVDSPAPATDTTSAADWHRVGTPTGARPAACAAPPAQRATVPCSARSVPARRWGYRHRSPAWWRVASAGPYR